jgi:murein DD-endopeptidase MepM/ murein hydrolase activator NlpD
MNWKRVCLRLSFLMMLSSPGCLAALAARRCTAAPSRARLGETIRLRCGINAADARLRDRKVRLFPQKDGGWMGLMPVALTDAPGSSAIQILDAEGKVLQSIPVTIRATKFPTQNVTMDPAAAGLHNSPEEVKTLLAFRESVSDQRYWKEPFAAPLPGCMTSPFGVKRLLNGKPTGEFHTGVDQRAEAGSAVRAVTAGVVQLAQPFTVLGGTVAIDHGQGVETIYLHLSKIAAEAGKKVEQGDVIGYVGSTGRSSGPHLHWALYVNGVNVNPAQWMKLPPCTRPAG